MFLSATATPSRVAGRQLQAAAIPEPTSPGSGSARAGTLARPIAKEGIIRSRETALGDPRIGVGNRGRIC